MLRKLYTLGPTRLVPSKKSFGEWSLQNLRASGDVPADWTCGKTWTVDAPE